MTTDVTLDGVDLSTAVPAAKILDVRRPLAGARRHTAVAIAGRADPYIFTEQPGARSLEFDVSIEADTFAARRAAVVALADWCDLGAEAQLIIDDEPNQYHNAILDDGDGALTELLRGGDATLRFLVGPYSLAVSTSSETVTATGGSDSGSFTPADTIVAEPIIELTPLNGTLTTFTLTLNGDTLTYASPTIASGNTLTISTISDTVTLGVNGDTMLVGAYTGTVVLADVDGAFPLIVPGSNTWALVWTGTATNVRVAITWRRRYR